MIKTFYFICTILFFGGCTNMTYKDISQKEEYSKIIGKTYKLQKELLIMANLTDDYKSKIILDYTITQPPGYNNRYVLWVKKIPKGTNIYIDKILSYDDLFYDDFKLLIKIDTSFLDTKLPIRMRSSLTEVTSDKKYTIMNSNIFQEIK